MDASQPTPSSAGLFQLLQAHVDTPLLHVDLFVFDGLRMLACLVGFGWVSSIRADDFWLRA